MTRLPFAPLAALVVAPAFAAEPIALHCGRLFDVPNVDFAMKDGVVHKAPTP